MHTYAHETGIAQMRAVCGFSQRFVGGTQKVRLALCHEAKG